MTLTLKRALALLPTGETIGDATHDDWRGEFGRAYGEHEENEKLGPATMTAEDRRIRAWLDRDHEFNEAVVYLRQRGYKIGGR